MKKAITLGKRKLWKKYTKELRIEKLGKKSERSIGSSKKRRKGKTKGNKNSWN